MEILYYQFQDNTCRFIYQHNYSGTQVQATKEVVSVENYVGMRDFLRRSGGQNIDPKEDIYSYIK